MRVAHARRGRTAVVEGVWPHEQAAADAAAEARTNAGPLVAAFILSMCYACALFQRVAFQGLTPFLVSDFDLSATDLADLGAVFFWAYLVLMIPAGLLVDAFGPKRMAIAGALVSSAGCALFAMAGTRVDLGVARVVISAGGAVAFICMMRFITLAFPAQRATISGRGILLGNLGAIAAGAPLAWLLGHLSWREIWACLSVGWLVLAIAVANRAPADSARTLASLQWRKVVFELRSVFSAPSTYVGIVVLAGLAGSYWAFANLIGPRLLANHRFTPLESGLEISVLVLGYAIGAAVWGWAGDRFRRDGALVVAATLACLTWAALLALGTPSFGIAATAFFLVGFFAGAFGLVYAVLTERYPPSHSGMVIACVNCGIPLGAAAAQSAAGRLDGELALLPLVAAGVAALAGAWALRATRTARRVRA